MISVAKKITLALLVSTLVACGGGGGSDNSSGNTSTNNALLTFSPAAINLSVVQGTSSAFVVNVKANRTIPQQINVGIIDRNGLITTDVRIVAVSTLEFNATLRTNGSLQPGTFNTTLEVRICEDDPLVCRVPISGSPTLLPMTLTVTPRP